MKALVTLALFVCLAGRVFALSSYTDSDLITLDTVAPPVEKPGISESCLVRKASVSGPSTSKSSPHGNR